MNPCSLSRTTVSTASRDDIELLIEPVVMAPLRREWAETKVVVDSLVATGSKKPGTASNKPPSPAVLKKAGGEADRIILRFLERLQRVTVLDLACGSGNFLYGTLQKLKEFEKEVIDPVKWLSFPEWTREEILEFPATSGGPWARFVVCHAYGWPAGLTDAEILSQLLVLNLHKTYSNRS